MLSNPHPPTRGREKGGTRRQTYKWDIKTALLITLIILRIREIRQNIQNLNWVSGIWVLQALASHWAAPGSPGLGPVIDGNWTQECTDCNLDQDRRQDKEQGPLRKPALNKESETLMIPQL